ncbi:type IV pilus twitching motility protein PilT [Patescibacteria group bacterium]|nr:type IV pilus twitching motility protein PilT [Patescibacteria group bacterium]MBU3922943.1 type IV pilus twitching motility protein PilT [Patescibacteria group bacterium]
MTKDYQLKLEELLEIAGKQNASDLHFSVGRKPTLRIDGSLIELAKYPVLTAENTKGFAEALVPEEKLPRLIKYKEVDFSYNYKDKARFRVNVFYQRGCLGAALRFFPSKIQTIKELRLPQVVESFINQSQGFILIVGPTGHGKTTTLAALVDHINHNQTKNIITIEDPIEYVFEQDKSIISQREVQNDTKTFKRALRSSFRQDPDVLVIGELRDLNSISTALTAAETGHLVLATLHTNNAAQTIDRIIDSFPAEAKNQVRTQLAATLLAVVSQRLIPRINGGRIPAVEIMIANAAVRNLIREGKIHQLDLVVETSAEEKMISLNRSLADLVHKGEISLENAEIYSLNPSDLKMLLGK